MSNIELILAIFLGLLLLIIVVYLVWKQKPQQNSKLPEKEDSAGAAALAASSRSLQLQAYERLILLTNRIALPNLINRVNQPGLNAKEMQTLLTQHIRQEFEYNTTQQIYVSAEAWEAVRNLKEQNLLIINQIASFLPADATGMDLNKGLLELVAQNPKASLQLIVAEALSFEAKKLMQ
ncbi:MAG: hypothetical protein P4L51_07150 [Puia sp.]|nr:hypothetical protein [Puia sp.]